MLIVYWLLFYILEKKFIFKNNMLLIVTVVFYYQSINIIYQYFEVFFKDTITTYYSKETKRLIFTWILKLVMIKRFL